MHGADIVRKALQAPARQIATNAGESGSVILGKILEHDNYGYGFDAQHADYFDMVKKGIIDPTKFVGQALQGASSVAGLLITTEAKIDELPKKKEAPAMRPSIRRFGEGPAANPELFALRRFGKAKQTSSQRRIVLLRRCAFRSDTP
jgi:hypothetical protein